MKGHVRQSIQPTPGADAASGLPCVFYVDMVPDDPRQILKLAGIRRYAALRGWDAVCAARADVQPAGIGDLLARHRPVGAIVEGSGRRAA